MSKDYPQTWPSLIAWLLIRTPFIMLGVFVTLYFGFIIFSLLRGSSVADALDPRIYVGRDCIQLQEAAGRAFEVNQCTGATRELNPTK